jgi:hypothetical protein
MLCSGKTHQKTQLKDLLVGTKQSGRVNIDPRKKKNPLNSVNLAKNPSSKS